MGPPTHTQHHPVRRPTPSDIPLPTRPPASLRPPSPELSCFQLRSLPPPRMCHTQLLPWDLPLSLPWEASRLGPVSSGCCCSPVPPPGSLIRWTGTVIVPSSVQHPTAQGEHEEQCGLPYPAPSSGPAQGLRAVWVNEKRKGPAEAQTHIREAALGGGGWSPRGGSENRPSLKGWGSREGQGRKAWGGVGGSPYKGFCLQSQACTWPAPAPSILLEEGPRPLSRGSTAQRNDLPYAVPELAQKALATCRVTGLGTHSPWYGACRGQSPRERVPSEAQLPTWPRDTQGPRLGSPRGHGADTKAGTSPLPRKLLHTPFLL